MKSFEDVLKNRFFYDHSFSIYEGMSGFFDLGPLGCLIQNNLVNEWRRFFVLGDKMLEVDCSILTPEIVLKASGHVKKFADIMVRDCETNEPFRADHLLKATLENTSKENHELNVILRKLESSQINNLEEIDEIVEKYKVKSPLTGNRLSKASYFNLMFQTKVGTSDTNKTTYMRPETAQGIFMNFQKLYNFNHKKLPLIVGKIRDFRSFV